MEFALNLAVAVFHIVGRDAEGSVHININIQVAVASIYIDLVEVAGEVFDGKCAVAQIIHVDVLFQLAHFAFSVFQFHVTAVQPVDMDVAIFGFDIHLSDVSEIEFGVFTVDIQLRTVANGGFVAIGQVQSRVVDIGDVHVAIFHVYVERSREVPAIEVAVFDMQVAFPFIVFRHDDITVLLCQVACQFGWHIVIVIDGEGFVGTAIPVLCFQVGNGRNRIARLFHPDVDTVDDGLCLLVIAGFCFDYDTDGYFALVPVRDCDVPEAVVHLQDVVFTDVETFVDFLFLDVFLFVAPTG